MSDTFEEDFEEDLEEEFRISRRADPFRTVDDLTIEVVEAVAGSHKTRTMFAAAHRAAVEKGRNTIIVLGTHVVIGEVLDYGRSLTPKIPIDEITTEPRRPQYRKGTVQARICDYTVRYAYSTGRILCITNEGFFRVGTWPIEAKQFDLILDEAPEIVLSREPFQLPHSHQVLTGFLNVNPLPTTLTERLNQKNQKQEAPPEFTTQPIIPIYGPKGERLDNPKRRVQSDKDRLIAYEEQLKSKNDLADSEKEMLKKVILQLKAKQEAWNTWQNYGVNVVNLAVSYYLLTPKPDFKREDPLIWVKLRQQASQVDDIFKYLAPVAAWTLQGAVLFVNMEAWNNMVLRMPSFDQKKNNRHVSIIGFRRPDKLKAFNKVTILSALFRHTLMYSVWSQLGVKFVPATEIDINDQTTDLGKRRLKIYWMYDEGWSKRARDDSGGIEKVLDLIKQSGVIAEDDQVCVVLNKDDGGPGDPMKVYPTFPKAIMMPHNTKGQNRFRQYHKLIYLAALNPNTFDIRWLESVLGIDPEQQRIARTALEVYQTAMRTSLRDPNATADVIIVVMDKVVAEWMAQWFAPSDQVSVEEIDSRGVIRRKKGVGGRPTLLGDRKLTQTEKNRRSREKKRKESGKGNKADTDA